MNTRSLSILSALLLGGCSLLFGVDDYDVATQSDAGQRDAGARDAGALDAGGLLDAGSTDAGTPDGGVRDAGPPARCTDVAHGCDLTIACSMPSPVPGADSSARVPFTVANLGERSGAGPFKVSVKMEHLGTFEEIGSQVFPGVLMPLESRDGEVGFVVPQWVTPGENLLRCTVDTDDQVPETDETNNEDTASLLATGLPDLFFASVSVSSNPSNPFHTMFEIENSGPTSAIMPEYLLSGGVDGGGGGTLTRQRVPIIEAFDVVRIMRDVSADDFSGRGLGDILYRVDPMNEIAESNESNNDIRRTVTW